MLWLIKSRHVSYQYMSVNMVVFQSQGRFHTSILSVNMVVSQSQGRFHTSILSVNMVVSQSQGRFHTSILSVNVVAHKVKACFIPVYVSKYGGLSKSRQVLYQYIVSEHVVSQSQGMFHTCILSVNVCITYILKKITELKHLFDQ